MEHAIDHESEIVGKQYSDAMVQRYDWSGTWPIVDPATMKIIGIEDGGWPSDPAVVLADVAGGQIVRYGDGCSDVAVRPEDVPASA